MNLIFKTLTLDVAKKNKKQKIMAKQYDNKTRFVNAIITNEGEKIKIGLDERVLINALRDNKESKSFEGTVNEDGTVLVPITYWMLEIDGLTECDISIIGADEETLTTESFNINVETASRSNDDISKDENLDILLSLIKNVTNIKAETVDKAVQIWLNNHPEATTTVQNKSLMAEKFTDELKLHTIKDYATPQMYGAKGDGTTDDTEAIQNCIDSSRIIYFPKGTYRITQPLEIDAGKTIRGFNNYETMIFCDGCDGIHFKANAERVTIKDIAFREFLSPTSYEDAKANDFPNGKHKLFTFNKAVVHCIFDNIWVRYFSDTFFYANGCGFINNIYIQNSTFEWGGNNCIEFLNDTSSQINDIVIRNTNVTLFENDGICVTGYNVSVETCSIQACRNGVRIDGNMLKTNKSSHAKGVVIRNNYFEQIRQSYIWINAKYDTTNGIYNYVSALTIMGNYGGAFNGVAETDENGNYYPAVRFTINTLKGVVPQSPKGKCVIGGVFYSANDFLTNDSRILIDGGNVLYDDCFFVTDSRFGNASAEHYDNDPNPPYQVVNMGNATIISRYIKYVDVLKLYEGYIPEGATVTNDKVVLQPQTKLYYNLKKNGVLSLKFDNIVVDGTKTNSLITIYGYLKDGTKVKLADKYLPIDAVSSAFDSTQFNNYNAYHYADFESYDIVISAGGNTLTVGNPILSYIK